VSSITFNFEILVMPTLSWKPKDCRYSSKLVTAERDLEIDMILDVHVK